MLQYPAVGVGKFRTANQLLASGDKKAACAALSGLADLIVAQERGKKISTADASALLAELSVLRAAAGCP